MDNYKKILLLIYSLTLLFLCQSCTDDRLVSSPDKRIVLSFDADTTMTYSVTVDGKPFILSSTLGFTADNGLDLSTGFRVKNIRHTSSDEIWSQPWGENKEIRDNHNQMQVDLENDKGVQLTLSFKLFNDGLGFRYEYQMPSDSVSILEELTAFNFAEDGRSWTIPASFETYELLYRDMSLSEVENANTPVTVKFDNLYASIHEAALTDFPEMTLSKSGITSFVSTLAHWPDGVKAKLGNKFKTPWRTIQIASDAVGLINSSLILNLNDPSAIKDTDWIKPFKYVGVWWGMHLGINSWTMDSRHGATTENAKKYIDFAVANNIEAVLFEGWNEGWDSWGGRQQFNYTKAYDDFNIEEIADYARKKGVMIIGHHETGGNVPYYESQLEEALDYSNRLAIPALKTGYAGGFPDGHSHHGQYGVRHYRKVVEATARHKIMLNAHEPIKDTGIRRTYPNMMTREGARGMEWNAWSDGNPPAHTLILPFTRMLSGPMDYTAGIFDILYENTKDHKDHQRWNDQDKGHSRVHTTLAKQMALWVILYSPMQMAADLIEHYDGHPAFQFFRDLDVDSDWSKALNGEPGEYITIVRRAKDNFFLGAATNEEGREITIPLDFLEKDKKYKLSAYADGDDAHWESNPVSYKIEHREVSSADSLTIKMAPGGGFAASFMLMQ